MKTITLNLYGIDELTQSVKERVFEKYRHYYTQDSFWYESDLCDFAEICKTIGIRLSQQDIFFRGFYSQGDGSCFRSTIDILDLLKGIRTESWKQYAPNLKLEFPKCSCDRRVIALIEGGNIGYTSRTKIPSRGYYVAYDSEYCWYRNSRSEYQNIEDELDKLDKWVESVLEILDEHLFSWLERQYENHTSDEFLQEGFKVHEVLFTHDGRMADYLLKLVEKG
ncbi:hypothetical protein ACS126_03750 [Sphingobacterium lactis]|uniref:hypothetical protein n=1 Tax=Sphingobacterium TaxID=28453 RepID=UPI0021A49C74|nr:hypothetical protein [Sphingobacterium hotanense]MCT1525310.1 hypothetical protein [Sphingobacterium hotanense]